jgi:diguanylate cyclase (GGDEF)-like protein
MRKFLGSAVLANLISMLRADIDGAIWISDRDDDARFYETRVAHHLSRIVCAPDIAVDVFNTIKDRGIVGVIATVQRENTARSDAVFSLDVGDVASLLIKPGCCLRVLEDVGGSAWLKASERTVGDLRHPAVHIANVFQRMRRALSLPKAAQFETGELIQKVVDWDSIQIDWDRLLQLLLNSGISDSRLEELRASNSGVGDFDMELVECDGLEALEVLAAATANFRPRGIQSSRVVDWATLFSMLRVAFDLTEFELQSMFWKMRSWQRTNDYPVLREWRSLDPLQEVLDQRYWENDLAAFIRQAQDKEVMLAIFKSDLDNCKNVNTQLGHSGGDDAIRLYCRIVRETLGRVGEVYRRGGDEVVAFAVGLGPQAAGEIAERLRAKIEREFDEWGKARGLDPTPTASIGVVVGAPDQSPADLVRVLDETQQRAKSGGKNRVEVFEMNGSAC